MQVSTFVAGAVILGAVAVSIHSQTTAPKTVLAAKVAVVAMRDAMLTTQDGRKAAAAMQAKFAERKAAIEKLQADLVALDDRIRKGGATIVSAAKAWGAELVVKVKEPQPDEIRFFLSGQRLFTFLHLAPNKSLTGALRPARSPSN